MFLEFNGKKQPIGLRIENAQKTLEINRLTLRRMKDFHMRIYINFAKIKVDITLVFPKEGRHPSSLSFTPTADNDYKIPESVTGAQLSKAKI